MRASLLATVIALALNTGVAMADDPLADPTATPAFAGTPSVVPPGALAPSPSTSAHLAVLSRGRIVLDPRRLRTIVEVRCRVATTGLCAANGTLTLPIHGHKTQIGAWKGRIPGQRIATPRFRLSALVRGLPRNRPLRAVLKLTNKATATTRAVTPPTQTVVTSIAVTIVVRLPTAIPVVTTGLASGITPPSMVAGGAPGTAVVAGIVNAVGSAASYHFEYGFAPDAYDHTTPATDVSVSIDGLDHLVTATLTGLGSPGTYHYRLVAENLGGTAFGADKHFAMPLVLPPFSNAPQGDATVAGPVLPEILDHHCFADSPALTTGTQMVCQVIVRNPQPPLFSVSAQQQFVVRPALVVLAMNAPAGMVGNATHSVVEPLTLSIPPQATVQDSVRFVVGHPPASGPGPVAQAVGTNPFTATMPTLAHARVTESVACAKNGPAVPGGSINCTFTTTNTGFDAADFSTFGIGRSGQLISASMIAGDPPQILPGILAGGGAPSAMTVRYRIHPDAQPGSRMLVSATAAGREETTRTPFSESAVSGAIVVEAP